MEKLTVLLTTYKENIEIFKEAIESIINQSFRHFKILIIIDDSSNDEIIKFLKEISKKDKRITYIVNEKNMGLAMSLNRGIDIIDTPYIARMDADDIADINRLEKQMKYMEEHPEIDIVGSNIIYIDYYGKILYKRRKTITSIEKTREAMKLVNIFNHPTLLGKTEIFKTFKYRNLRYSQDYDFICRALEQGKVIVNMPDYLLFYRNPLKVKEEKLVQQRITYFCIQKYYKKEKLNDTNIEEIVATKYKKINYKHFLKAINLYDKALNELKEKKKEKFLLYILLSCIMSRYQRQQTINLLKYYIIKKGEHND